MQNLVIITLKENSSKKIQLLQGLIIFIVIMRIVKINIKVLMMPRK